MNLHDSDAIPADIQRFILLAIPSIPYLEALLLLRSAPALTWDAVQVSRRLYLGEKPAQGLLDQLYAAGILTAESDTGKHFRYAPQTEQLRTLIDRLAAIYSSNLIGVTHLIHSTLNKKARQFADAFVFRK